MYVRLLWAIIHAYIYIYCGFDFLPLRQLYKFQATNVHKYVVLGIAILE
jgi:hypothetical protein